MADVPHGFGIYVHWPFCQAKCPYCDFNSHVAARVDQSHWRVAYAAEIAAQAALAPDHVVTSVFFGGGTPSLMDPDLVDAILGGIRRAWRTGNNVEVTLEANPTSVEAGRFRAYRAAGVNRISMGIQALDDADLRRLGRRHSVAEARAAFDIARATFDRVSFDLIYARQGQTVTAWRTELHEALSMAVDHLSLYQLTIEDGTAFGDRLARGGLRGLPNEELAADLYEATQDICAAADLPAYEVSNHAATDAQSRHNLTYWRCGDYAGIGPGAHGRLTLPTGRVATEAIRSPDGWLAAASRNATLAVEALTAIEQAQEILLMGLRLASGVDRRRIDVLAPGLLREDRLNELAHRGLVVADAETLRVTPSGMPLLNGILRHLL